MDHTLAEPGLSLTYLHNPSSNEAFDPCRILDDLSDSGIAMLPWQNPFRMAESDHLVLAAAGNDGGCLGVLAASDLATEREPFLFLDVVCVAPVARTSNLLQRMVALAMLRIAGTTAVPTVLAACVRTPCCAQSLHELGTLFTAAALFPAVPDGVVIDLGMASLARRIARVVRPGSHYEAATGVFRSDAPGGMARRPGGSTGVPSGIPGGIHRMEETLIVVDLGMASEATILDDARKLYRTRPKSTARRGFADAVASDALRPRRRLRGATAR
jgi:hypothetical protein